MPKSTQDSNQRSSQTPSKVHSLETTAHNYPEIGTVICHCCFGLIAILVQWYFRLIF